MHSATKALERVDWAAQGFPEPMSSDRGDQRFAGRVVAETLQYVQLLVEQGEDNTMVLNNKAEDFMLQKGVVPACKGYQPPFHKEKYLYGTCLSVNHEIVHGVPGINKIVQEGDILSIDIVGVFNGWHADAAITIPVGTVNGKAQKLIDVTERALYKGIEKVKANGHTGDIGNVINRHARNYGLGVAKYLSGHGIGKHIHCSPTLANRGKPHTGEILLKNTSFCIEPMFTLGSDDNKIAEDTWAIITADGSLAAHFEHTVFINDKEEVEILTQL
jgi:methionyl aminopeptidase